MKKFFLFIILFFSLLLASPNKDSAIRILGEENLYYSIYDKPENKLPNIIKNISKFDWQKISSLSKEDLFVNKSIWFKVLIPKNNYIYPSIAFEGILGDVTIYRDSVKILNFNNLQSKYTYLYPYNKLIRLSANDSSVFYVNVKYNNLLAATGVNNIVIGETDNIIDFLLNNRKVYFIKYLYSVLISSILFVLAVISYFFFFKNFRIKIYPYLYFGSLCISAFFSHSLEFLWVELMTNTVFSHIYISLLVIFLMPVFFSLFIKSIFGNGWKNCFSYFWKISLVVSLSYTILSIWLPVLLAVSMYLLILNIVAIVILIFISKFNNKKNANYIFYSIFIVISASLIDLLSAIGILDIYFELYGASIIILAIAFLNLIINHFKETIHDLQKAENEVKAKELEMIRLKKENLQSQYDSLKSQINPHFLFNTYSTLINLIEENQEQAVEFVQQLSNVYRYVLQNKDRDIIEVGEETEFAYAYIFLLKKRFSEGFFYNINIPKNYLSYSTIPLCLQILLENCIKHNIVSEKKPLYIDIYIDSGTEYLYIKNNLQPKNTVENSTKVGLNNIINRFSLLTKKEVLIYVSNEYYLVGIPLIKKNECLL